MKVTIKEYEIVCCVCGNHSDHYIISKSDAPGAPDLDLRPSVPHRRSMDYWVMECPECGYCNDMLVNPIKFDKEYLKSEEYTGLGGIETDNPLASKFIKKALVCKMNENLSEAVQSYLYAAWVFDDAEDDKTASVCRAAAIKLMDDNKEIFRNNENFLILKADLLRRCGEFERVISEFSGYKFSKPIFNVISEFQIRLARNSDKKVYTTDMIPGVTVRK